MNSPSHILVTGASGAVGPRVVAALCEAGHRVRSYSLPGPGPNGFAPEVEVIHGDIADAPAVRAAMQGVDAVIHMAALLHIVDPSAALRGEYERVNVEGTRAVVEAALQAGVRRVVFFSTIAVYGCGTGAVFTEETPPQPDTLYAQTKLAAERIVLNARRPDGQSLGAVLRLGAVYGARIKGNYERLTRALARGRFVPVGDGYNRRTLIYDRDVARAAVLAMQHPAAAGRVYNVSDGMFHPMRDIIAAICEALGRKRPRLALPLGPVRLAAGMLEHATRLLGQQSHIGRATIDKYTEDVAVNSQHIRRELGYVTQYDLKVGWRETVREMRASGDL